MESFEASPLPVIEGTQTNDHPCPASLRSLALLKDFRCFTAFLTWNLINPFYFHDSLEDWRRSLARSSARDKSEEFFNSPRIIGRFRFSKSSRNLHNKFFECLCRKLSLLEFFDDNSGGASEVITEDFSSLGLSCEIRCLRWKENKLKVFNWKKKFVKKFRLRLANRPRFIFLF